MDPRPVARRLALELREAEVAREVQRAQGSRPSRRRAYSASGASYRVQKLAGLSFERVSGKPTAPACGPA